MKAICLILGAGKGVSLAVAKKFAARDYHVALACRDKAKLEAFKDNFDAGNISTWTCDVTDSSAVKHLVEELTSSVGTIEVLIYNAFVLAAAKPSKLPPEKFDQSLNVNLKAALVSAQAVIPAMSEAAKGTIIFTGGGYAIHPSAKLAALSVGKAALRSLALCLHEEMAPLGIHAGTVTICGVVQPGTAFDPDKIADSYVELHEQLPEKFESEIVFAGE